MKNITIAGRATKDAEMKTTQGGNEILQFSVAVDDYRDGQKVGMLFDCALFGKRAQSLEQHIKKGSSLTVSGDFSTNEHNGKTYLKIAANSVTLMGGKPAERDEPRRETPSQRVARESHQRPLDDDMDSIPF